MKIKTKHVCQFCGRGFEASPKAKYCCGACKQAAYRKRKESCSVTTVEVNNE
jgi:hypothetical protein